MATAESVKSKIQGLIAAANATTGNSDSDLTTAVNALVAGFGSGGSGGSDELAASIIDKSVTMVNFDELDVATISDYSFYNCKNLTNITSNNVTKVGAYAFNGCSELTSVDFPLATTIGGRAFLNCTSISSVNIPRASFTSGQPSVLQGCTSLQTVNNIKGQLANSFFNGCTALESAHLTGVTKFVGSQVFLNCSALTTIVLPNTALVSLSNTNCFTGTPFASGGTGGTVYVPQALIESYQTATNWSTLYAAGTCNFVAIEGSEYE